MNLLLKRTRVRIDVKHRILALLATTLPPLNAPKEVEACKKKAKLKSQVLLLE
jgi:hypothetical protein